MVSALKRVDLPTLGRPTIPRRSIDQMVTWNRERRNGGTGEQRARPRLRTADSSLGHTASRSPVPRSRSPFLLNRLIATSIPSATQHSTASAIGSSRASSAARSSRVNWSRTKSASCRRAGGQRSDADPEPGVVLAAERALDALEAVVAAGRAGAAQPEPAERQGDVVHAGPAGRWRGRSPEANGARPARPRSGSCRSAA